MTQNASVAIVLEVYVQSQVNPLYNPTPHYSPGRKFVSHQWQYVYPLYLT